MFGTIVAPRLLSRHFGLTNIANQSGFGAICIQMVQMFIFASINLTVTAFQKAFGRLGITDRHMLHMGIVTVGLIAAWTLELHPLVHF